MEILQASRVLSLTAVSFLVALAGTPFVVKLLYHFKFHKQIRSKELAPVFYSLHQSKENTPTMGGVIIWGTVIILAMLISALLGLLDDLAGVLHIGPHGGGLKVSQKLWLYAFLAALGSLWFYFRLDWDVLYIPFFGNVTIGWWYIPIFMFIIIASAFSANETDGLDGLAGGVMLFAFASFTVVAFALARYDLATFCGVIVGALLAFLWFNIYPARFFMGDTGSMALGITMGVVAMLTNTTLFLPFFAIVLIFESLSVIVQMISKKVRGKKIFLSTPIHHHFEAIGWPETKVTMRFWIIAVVTNVLGLVFFFISRYFAQ